MSTFAGVLIGLHRNEYPALVIGGSRILGALVVVVAVRHTNSLAYLALCIGVTNLVGAGSQYLIAKALLPGMRMRLTKITLVMAGELARYCSGLTVVSFAMLLISGLDVTIVGYFNFRQVSAYAIASMFYDIRCRALVVRSLALCLPSGRTARAPRVPKDSQTSDENIRTELLCESGISHARLFCWKAVAPFMGR